MCFQVGRVDHDSLFFAVICGKTYPSGEGRLTGFWRQ